MAAYRENARGEVEVFAHRVKAWLLTLGFIVLGLVSLLALIDDPRQWWAWVGVLLFGGGGTLWFRRYLRAGIFTGKPALVLGPQGIHDSQSGVRVAWDEVERVEAWEMHTRGSTQRYLGLWVIDPDRFSGGVLASLPFFDHLGGTVLAGRPPVNVPTSLLATTTEELAGLVRRFYRGPIQGVAGPIDTTPERPSRLRRFTAWAIEWAIGIALAAGVVALLVWLS